MRTKEEQKILEARVRKEIRRQDVRNKELRAEFQELIDLAREYENVLKEHKDDETIL
jgi:hypothetical protein